MRIALFFDEIPVTPQAMNTISCSILKGTNRVLPTEINTHSRRRFERELKRIKRMYGAGGKKKKGRKG